VEADDEGLLVGGEVAALDVGAEVVDPAEAAALAAAEQPGLPRQRAPVGVAVLPDVGHQPLVLLGAPRAPPQPLLLAARRPPHRPARARRRQRSSWPPLELDGRRSRSGGDSVVLLSGSGRRRASERERGGVERREDDGDGLSPAWGIYGGRGRRRRRQASERGEGLRGQKWKTWGKKSGETRLRVRTHARLAFLFPSGSPSWVHRALACSAVLLLARTLLQRCALDSCCGVWRAPLSLQVFFFAS
jgi:hypothetical protein